ncbi:MAG: HEAT repeat domain-containing protein, partial [Anaerolineales bacterium]|nr:HEAT repeat domain-containing protein [Anaerolineales bacterium]
SQGEAKRLIAQLADSTKRDIAAKELIKLGADAVPPLIDALQTQDPNLILTIQHILARIPTATPALTKTLAMTTHHPTVRARVAEIFGMSRDRSAIPALLDALKDQYFTVRAPAALALGNIGDAQVIPSLLPLLKDKDNEVRSAACVAIAKFRDPSTFDDITNVLLDDPMIEARQSAAIALGDTKHPAAIPFLMEALRDSSWWFEREQAAADLLNAIEKMGVAVVEPLIEALGDKEGTVRRYAAIMLGRMGDPRAIEELGMTLYDLHDEVGKAAAEALAKFGAPTVDIFIEALNHPEAGIRENSVVALSKIQDARVVPVLIEMLADPARDVKKQAMQALGELRDRRAIHALQEIVSNRADRELSALAKQIIESMK